MIDAGVGISTANDSFHAGYEAAKEALSQMSTKPKVIILAIDGISRKKYDYQKVIDGVRSELGPEPKLIGSTVNGILVEDRFALKSVGVMLLGGDISVDGAFNYGKSRVKYKEIAQEILKIKAQIPKNPNQILFMFQDGIKFPPEIMEQQKMLNNRMVSLLTGFITKLFRRKLEDFSEIGKGMPSTQELVGELYDHGWDIPIIGNVSTILKDYESYEFFGNGVYDDAVMGLFLSPLGNNRFGFGYAAGAVPTGVQCTVTKNVGNFLLRIDDKPALQGFCDAIGIEMESLVNLENEGYINYYHMLGTREKVGDKEYIHLTGTITNPELPNLIVSGFPFDKVPKKLEIFRSDLKVLLDTTRQAIMDSLQSIDEPRFLLGIDCIVRLLAYGDNLPRGIKVIDEILGKDVPRMIFGSGGEIWGTKKDDFYFNNMTFLTFLGGK